MIVEGLVTTTDATGGPHLAPMGPTVDAAFTKLLLRPFPTSNTYQNLLRHGEGVFHITDDARLIALAAVGAVPELPAVNPAESVRGFVLADCCRAFEFVVRKVDTSRERVHLEADIVKTHRVRDFLGFNRAKHAVLEAAILATRFHLLPAAEIDAEFKKLRVIVEKTGTDAEREAMAVLEEKWRTFKCQSGSSPEGGPHPAASRPPSPCDPALAGRRERVEGGWSSAFTPLSPRPGFGTVSEGEGPGVRAETQGRGGLAVRAPSRLHFGLLTVPTADTPADARLFGGVGLMVSDPGVTVRVSRVDSWSASGPSADRALGFARRFVESLAPNPHPAFRIEVLSCPPEHIGLGVGTQLGLAVAKAVAAELGLPHLSAVELAERVGRGARSGAGVHGFDGGGLILDAGKRNGQAVSELSVRRQLPNEWRVVLACPRGAPRWHGDAERRAFAKPSAVDTTRLRHLFEVLGEATDYATFAEALHEYNRLAGAVFAEAQGGEYSSPTVAELIARVRNLGVPAVGQSSWGPTVFAVTPDADRAAWLSEKLTAPEMEFVTVTRPDAAGGILLE